MQHQTCFTDTALYWLWSPDRRQASGLLAGDPVVRSAPGLAPLQPHLSPSMGFSLSLCSSCSQDGCQSTCLQHLDPLTEIFRREGRSLPRGPKPITHESSGAHPPPAPRPRELGQRKKSSESSASRGGGGAGGAQSARCCRVSWGEARGPGGSRGRGVPGGGGAPSLSPFLVLPASLPPALTFPGLTPPPKPRGPGAEEPGVLHAPRRHG